MIVHGAQRVLVGAETLGDVIPLDVRALEPALAELEHLDIVGRGEAAGAEERQCTLVADAAQHGTLVDRPEGPGADDHAVVRGRRDRAQQHRLLIVDDRVRENDHVAIGDRDAVRLGLAQRASSSCFFASIATFASSPQTGSHCATGRPVGISSSKQAWPLPRLRALPLMFICETGMPRTIVRM